MKKTEAINQMIELNKKIEETIQSKNIDWQIGYCKDFEIIDAGLGTRDVFIRRVEIKNNKKSKQRKAETSKSKTENKTEEQKPQYEIYNKDNQLIATVNENGNINFEPEFLEELEDISPEYFKTLDLDDAEINMEEALEEADIVLSKNEIEKETLKREKKQMAGSKDIKEQEKEEPQKSNSSHKQEIDPYVKVTSTETLADMIPEIKQKGYAKVVVDYSDHSKGQNGRFTFKGVDEKGVEHPIKSLENTEGTTTGQTVTSINSRDGSVIEEEQVSGLVKIRGRSSTNGQEELLSLKTGPYGTIEVDYVRAELDKDKKTRYFSAPIATPNQRETTTDVRELMDRSRNIDMDDELDRANAEIKRNGETEMVNIDDTASNDNLTADDIIILEDGTKTTLRQEALKDHVQDVDEFVRRYNERGGKTPDEKIEAVHEQYEEEFIGNDRRR